MEVKIITSIDIVLHIIYKDDDKPPALPIAVIVQFEEGYIGPSFCNDLPNCVPIPPVLAISDTLGSAHERRQSPLQLARSITIHKSQDLTINKVWINLGPSEKAAGLAYVALSRVRKLEGLIIEPMTHDRLCIKNCSNYRYRIREEQRLTDLFHETFTRYYNSLQ